MTLFMLAVKQATGLTSHPMDAAVACRRGWYRSRKTAERVALTLCSSRRAKAYGSRLYVRVEELSPEVWRNHAIPWTNWKRT